MTLQQLKYLVAIDKHRNYARAAAELHVTQPTLSALVAKLEDELGVRIFERSNRSVTPTPIGRHIISQAERTLAEAGRIAELVTEAKSGLTGSLSLSVGPTIAPYILPRFISAYSHDFPQVELSIVEMKAENMVNELRLGHLDVGLATAGHATEGVWEIPFYTEPFWVYIAESCWRKLPVFNPANLSHEQMWVMRESQCLRDSAFSFCKGRDIGKRAYEAGSIDTLIRIVDANGGFTIIPEMHLPLLSDKQRENVRRIEGDYRSTRRVSLYVSTGFIRERMLNSLMSTLLTIIPRAMVEERILKYSIKL